MCDPSPRAAAPIPAPLPLRPAPFSQGRACGDAESPVSKRDRFANLSIQTRLLLQIFHTFTASLPRRLPLLAPRGAPAFDATQDDHLLGTHFRSAVVREIFRLPIS